MSSNRDANSLDQARERIADRVRALRRERGWTQAELGEALGLSQARLSEIERGQGSFSAEQLLEVLERFNVSIAEFLPHADPDDALQNALIQLGAAHLRHASGVAASGRPIAPDDALVDTLLRARAARLVTAWAPVLVHQGEAVSLPAVRARIAAVGREQRLGWLLENVRAALATTPPTASAAWRRMAARATAVLDEELAHFPPPDEHRALDLFDPTVRSATSRELVWQERASPISRRWRVVSELQPEDFREAVWSAHGPG